MKKFILLIFIVLNIIYLSLPVFAVEATDPDTELFLRLHIRANSDNKEDQDLKLKVRDAVLTYTTTLLSNINNKIDAIKIISDNLTIITEKAEAVIKDCGFTYDVKTEIKKEFFEKREYDGFFLPADIYDSLILEIGEGKGHNWWCVIFPAVCVSGSFKVQSSKEDFTDDEDLAPVINIEMVPEKYRLNLELAESPVPKKVKYEFWIVEFIKSIISMFEK